MVNWPHLILFNFWFNNQYSKKTATAPPIGPFFTANLRPIDVKFNHKNFNRVRIY